MRVTVHIEHRYRLWVHDYNYYLDFLAANKFNVIRVLLALDTVMSAWHLLQADNCSSCIPHTPPPPGTPDDPEIYGLHFGTCPGDKNCNLDLEGLTSLQALDVMVAAAARRGIYVSWAVHVSPQFANTHTL